jgi:septum formation protein
MPPLEGEARPEDLTPPRRDNRPMTPSSPFSTPPALILASTSRYRRELLERLRLPFEARSPEVDETPLPGEAPAALAERLALAKARVLAAQRPDAVVIGADQVADVDGVAIGKPGDHARATAQLRTMSGRRIVFQTAVAVVREAVGFAAVRRVPVTVRFRTLDDAEIEFYLRAEQPYDCAGSAKCETLGIALLEAIESDDPTALVGLPLIRTSELLRAAGLDPLRPGGIAAPEAAR